MLMPGLRGLLKGVAEGLLAGSPLPRIARKRHAGHCVVLALHNIVPNGHRVAGDRPLHLSVSDFERFLDMLTATHTIVALDELDASAAGDRPRAAITFDDAYAGALHRGLPVLASRQLPATIFVAPGLLGRPACWWDRLADPTVGLDAHIRDTALRRLRGEDSAIMRWAATTGLRASSITESFRIATSDELAVAARQPRITLGAHTWDHPNLTELRAAELTKELEQPLKWLRENFQSARPWLAYPYGMTSPAVAQAAKQAGYALGFRVSGGWITPGQDSWTLPRWSVPSGLSARGFVLHAAGVLGD